MSHSFGLRLWKSSDEGQSDDPHFRVAGYARRARLTLQDPRIANCGDSWTTRPECDWVLETTKRER